MSTHNIGFYEDLTKLSLNYHQISSNTHLISSAADMQKYFFAHTKACYMNEPLCEGKNGAFAQSYFCLLSTKNVKHLVSSFKISSLWLVSVAQQASLCLNRSETLKKCFIVTKLTYEPRCEKTGLRGFRPPPTQTRLNSYRRWLEA